MRWNCLLAGIGMLVAGFQFGAHADEAEPTRAEYIRANYTKFEYRIPMRDGVELFTSVYAPNDRTQSYPMLMLRTPYGIQPYGASRYRERLGPSKLYERDGFIFVFQDVRGTYMSGGEFDNMRPHVPDKKSREQTDESTDTFDTIDWLLANVENHNGRVGQWGVSYPGFYTSAGMIDSHPALRAASPQAPIADWFWDDMHHHGAFILHMAFNFFANFGQSRPEPTTERNERFDHETPDAYQFFLDMGPLRNANEKYLENEIAFWDDIVEHPNYDEDLQGGGIEQPRHGQHAGDGSVGARRLVPVRRRETGGCRVRLQDGGVLSRASRVSFLPALPQGRPGPGTARGPGVRDRGQPLASIRQLAPGGDPEDEDLHGRGRRPGLRTAGGPERLA
jgi:hypothetical protein